MNVRDLEKKKKKKPTIKKTKRWRDFSFQEGFSYEIGPFCCRDEKEPPDGRDWPAPGYGKISGFAGGSAGKRALTSN